MSSRNRERRPLFPERAAGVLVHPTSFPGLGVGTLGEGARRVLDWMAGAGQSYWQILPLVAPSDGGSPYGGISALAGNALLIDPEELVREGLLDRSDLGDAPSREGTVDFEAVSAWKRGLLARALEGWEASASASRRADLERYREQSAAWLDDYALFAALRDHHQGASWIDWEPGARERDPAALERWRERLEREVRRIELEQFLFDRQWAALRGYAHERGIRVVGDLPIFVDHNSVDVWANRHLFRLDEAGLPVVVSGVPPDYFSETGQRWGNPIYRWDALRESGYDWWVERFRRTLEWVDLVRVDHFRGFEAYWEIPADEETAIQGEWRPGPGAELFHAVEERLGVLPVIAEDLGVITEEVEALREELGFPGMRVVQFAFDGKDDNPHLPGNHPANTVAYTGTHDNDTARGWWTSVSDAEREGVLGALAETPPDEQIHWALIEMVYRSPARLAVVPLQDVLGLGSEARMNTPGTVGANWGWRVPEGALTAEAQRRLRELTRLAGREPNQRREHT